MESVDDSQILPPPIPTAAMFTLTPQSMGPQTGEPPMDIEMLPGAATRSPQTSLTTHPNPPPSSNLLSGPELPSPTNVLDIERVNDRAAQQQQLQQQREGNDNSNNNNNNNNNNSIIAVNSGGVTDPSEEEMETRGDGGDEGAVTLGSGLATPNAAASGLQPTDIDMLQELMVDGSPPGGQIRSPNVQVPFLNEDRVAVLSNRSKFTSFRRGAGTNNNNNPQPECWADGSEASSTDTRMSNYDDRNYYSRALLDVAQGPKASEHSFSSLPLELLRHIADSYISIRYHLSLRLVNRKVNVLVMSNCCFWQRKVPNYREMDHEESKACLLLRPRRTTVRDVSDIMVSLNSRPGSRAGSRANSPLPEGHLSPNGSPRGSFTTTAGGSLVAVGPPAIIYCFQGCAYQVWRLLAIEEKARKFRKSQRHELRAIAADTFASFLFPTAGSNAISFFLSCTMFALLITEISLFYYSETGIFTYREYLPFWLAVVVALPLGAMYMYESSAQRRVLAILTYVSVVISSGLVFLFRAGFVDLEVPWSLCLLPFFLMCLASAVMECSALVTRSQYIAGRLVPIRDIFVNQKKRHVPMTPVQFLWLNVAFSISSIVFLMIGFFFFMLECDGIINKADATFYQYNESNVTVISNVTVLWNTTHTVGIWEGPMPTYVSGFSLFIGWMLSIGKVGCVVMAYYSKHLRKYADCSFIVVGHGVLFFFLGILSLSLMFPVDANPEGMAQPSDSDSLGMLEVLLANNTRRTVLYVLTLGTLIVYFIISFVNTLSSKEKYYKTSLRTKYLPYFDTTVDDASVA